jgi:hypothetical protein
MQNFDHKIGFGEKRQFFRRKLKKILIITSIPGKLAYPIFFHFVFEDVLVVAQRALEEVARRLSGRLGTAFVEPVNRAKGSILRKRFI